DPAAPAASPPLAHRHAPRRSHPPGTISRCDTLSMPTLGAVWRAAAVLLLALLPSNVVATALPLLRVEWSASATALGWVFAAYQVGYVGAVLLLLPLTDPASARPRTAGTA